MQCEGILAMGATNSLFGAKFILGCTTLSDSSYVTERWHAVLIGYLVTLTGVLINIYFPRFLDKISRAAMIWNLLAFVAVLITVLACNDHKQPASFVFKDFQNFTGFGAAYCGLLGLLQSSFGMCW